MRTVDPPDKNDKSTRYIGNVLGTPWTWPSAYRPPSGVAGCPTLQRCGRLLWRWYIFDGGVQKCALKECITQRGSCCERSLVHQLLCHGGWRLVWTTTPFVSACGCGCRQERNSPSVNEVLEGTKIAVVIRAMQVVRLHSILEALIFAGTTAIGLIPILHLWRHTLERARPS